MIILLLSVPLVVFSVLAIRSADLLLSVIYLAVISLNLAAIFLLLQAPDIAITEAAVNAGLTTLIYVIAIKKSRRYEE